MKKMTSFLTMALFFSNLIAMEEEAERIDYEKLCQINDMQEQIKYHLIQKDIAAVLTFLTKIRRTARHFSESIKKDIQNRIVLLVLQSLPISDTTAAEFKNEFYRLGNNDSYLSSNDPSPRIEENGVQSNDEGSEIIETLDKQKEILKYLKKNSKKGKQKRFVLLTRVKAKLEELNKDIKQAQSDLRMACYNGDIDSFKKKYEEYGELLDLNDLNGVYKGLLHYAVDNGDDEILAYILSQGANTEIIDIHGDTPLLLAVKLINETAVDYLLKYDANPYMSDKGGLWQKPEGSKITLSLISTQNSLDSLLVAYHNKKSNKNTIEKSIKNYIRQLSKEQKFRFMAQAGKLRQLEILVEEAEKEFSNSESPEELMTLLINSVDPRNGKSALHYAIEKQEKLIIIYLIGIKINPDIEDFEGDTPLHCAVMGKYCLGVYLLLFGEADGIITDLGFDYKGARKDKKNNRGYTPQRIAELLEDADILKAFRAEREDLARYKNKPSSSTSNSFLELEDNSKFSSISSSANQLSDLEDNDEEAEEKPSASFSTDKLSYLEDVVEEPRVRTVDLRNKNARRKSMVFSFGSLRKTINRKSKNNTMGDK